MSSRLPRSVLIAPILGVALAGILVLLSLRSARETFRHAGISNQLSAVDVAACAVEPSSWGWRTGDVSLFAYDRDGHSANPKAPA
ncbi:MAG: hypothetical protein AAFY60_21340, partial [Myxococcota bacterium]